MAADRCSHLREKLDIIATLEKENGVLGVSFVVPPNCSAFTEEVADYVIDFIRHGATLVANRTDIPLQTAR
jgi:hypothetical protein